MNKKNKIAIIVATVVIIILVIGLLIFFAVKNGESSNEIKLNKLYNNLIKSNNYSIELNLDKDNKKIISKNGEKANIDLYTKDEHTTTLVKDGTTYLIVHNDKMYYSYQNNTQALVSLTQSLEELQSVTPTKGEEKIENNSYKYEEYEGITTFVMNQEGIVQKTDIKTRFYFRNDDLIYIKNIVNGKEEVIKTEIKYNTNNIKFDIPSEYKQG